MRTGPGRAWKSVRMSGRRTTVPVNTCLAWFEACSRVEGTRGGICILNKTQNIPSVRIALAGPPRAVMCTAEEDQELAPE